MARRPKNPEADAKKIAKRLRETNCTLTKLRTEYRCGYRRLIAVVRAEIPIDEWVKIRKKKLGQGFKKGGTYFKKGHIPWNKGKSYNPGGRSIETRFKKGHLRGMAARSYRHIGTITIRCDKLLRRLRHRIRKKGMPPWPRKRRRWLKVSDYGPPQFRWVPYARWLWEKNNGPIPPGFMVTHKDSNQMNDSPDNLILITQAQNLKRNVTPQVRKLARKLGAKAKRRNCAERKKLEAFYGRQFIRWDCVYCSASYYQDEQPLRCEKCGNSSFEKITYRRKTGS